MSDTIRLLNQLSQTAETGINALTAVIPMVKNNRMKRQLVHQLTAYKDFAEQTGIKAKGTMAGTLSKLNLKAQSGLNPTPSHIAQMMMQGSGMGLIKTQKAVNHNKNASKNVKELANRMLEFEQNTIDAYRSFL